MQKKSKKRNIFTLIFSIIIIVINVLIISKTDIIAKQSPKYGY